MWASVPDDDTIARVDPRTGRSIPGSAGAHPMQLAYTAGRVYVACINDQTLVVLNPDSLKRTHTLRVPFNPYAVTADASHVWVTGVGEDTVTRVDAR